MTLVEAAQSASQETPWVVLFVAGALGGLAAKGLDIVYSAYIRHAETRKGLKEFVDTDSDPVLKAADELVGKMTSLANEDFSSLRGEPTGVVRDDATVELASVLYLLAQFWARVEILRNESLYVRLAESKQGRELSAFLRSIESRAVRITDRARQRAIGELLIREGPNHRECMTFQEFASAYQSDERMQGWLHPLVVIVQGTARGSPSERSTARQALLKYGAVLHAMIDTLDPKHLTTKQRPSFPHKLSLATRRDLRFRVFATYLPSVREVAKYTGEAPRGSAK